MNTKVNIKDKLSLFNETWTPKIIGELNNQQVKLAKLEGEFTWHAHDDEDELFLILEGSLLMQIRNDSGEIEELPKTAHRCFYSNPLAPSTPGY